MNVAYDRRTSRSSRAERPQFAVSFEFFPPKSDAMEERFWESIGRLAPLRPRFVSVTYGAGGSTRERTLRMVSRIKAESGVDAAAHLTCVGATRADVDAVVRGYREAGISRIVALRGDPPEGVGQPFTPHPEGYRNAAELVAGVGLRERDRFNTRHAARAIAFAQGELLEPYLAEIAFSLQAGQVAGPIATPLGYHVVQVVERADQPVPEEKRPLVAQGQFELWLDGLRSAATIEIY